jgi:hypothetical protein
MRALATLAILGLFTGPVLACDYRTDSYRGYGYGAAASVLKETGLKAGLRGAHVDTPKEDVYHQGFIVGDPKQIVLLHAGPR